jgi:hypothetical protein
MFLLLYSALGGKLDAKFWTRELNMGDFKYVVADDKYAKVRGGGERNRLTRVGTS